VKFCNRRVHGYELAPTTEPTGVALGPVLHDGPLKFGAGKQLQHLAENARYSYHSGVSPPYGSRLSTQTVAEFYRRRSKANLDKRDPGYGLFRPIRHRFQTGKTSDELMSLIA
jgi:hypothetical protein